MVPCKSRVAWALQKILNTTKIVCVVQLAPGRRMPPVVVVVGEEKMTPHIDTHLDPVNDNVIYNGSGVIMEKQIKRFRRIHFIYALTFYILLISHRRQLQRGAQ